MKMPRPVRIAMLALTALGTAGCMPSTFLVRAVPDDRGLQEREIRRDPGLFVSDKIAVIEVDGIMVNMRRGGMFQAGDNPVSLFLEKLDKARKDPHVKAVVLRLNSPGGTVSASDVMYHALLEFKKVSDKPVIACMLDVAASGAYYLACGADGIVAQPTTITGSIGTVMQTVSFEGILKKLGIRPQTIKSGKLKDLASPFHDMRSEEEEVLQQIIDDFYEGFLAVVLKGRGDLTETRLRALADGRVFTAQQARIAGLIDRIGYPDDAIAWARKLAGIDKGKVIIYQRSFDNKSTIYATAAEPVTAAALVDLGIPHWLKAQGPQFLYLWQGFNQQ